MGTRDYLCLKTCHRCDGSGRVGVPGWRFWRNVECPECGGPGIAAKPVKMPATPPPPPPPPRYFRPPVNPGPKIQPSRREPEPDRTLETLVIADLLLSTHDTPDTGYTTPDFSGGGGESGGAGASGGWDSTPDSGSCDSGSSGDSSGGDSSSGAD